MIRRDVRSSSCSVALRTIQPRSPSVSPWSPKMTTTVSGRVAAVELSEQALQEIVRVADAAVERSET